MLSYNSTHTYSITTPPHTPPLPNTLHSTLRSHAVPMHIYAHTYAYTAIYKRCLDPPCATMFGAQRRGGVVQLAHAPHRNQH